MLVPVAYFWGKGKKGLKSSVAFTTMLPAADVPVQPAVVLVHGFASTPLHNWGKTKWVGTLLTAGHPVHLVTLPFHRLDEVETGEYVPQVEQQIMWGRQDAVVQLAEVISSYLAGWGQPVHLMGFSLGARIAWQLAATSPKQVLSLVAGAMPVGSKLDEVHLGLIGQAALPTEFAPVLEATSVPHENLADFTATSFPTLDPHTVPSCPVLMVVGGNDTVAADAAEAYTLLDPEKSSWLEVQGRDHINLLTSGQVRRAVLTFLTGI